MIFVLLVFSGIFCTEAYISIKNNDSNLENCINELVTSTIPRKQFVYVINTNIKIKNHPTVFYNTISAIKKMSTMIPDVYVVSGNISEILNVLQKSEMLANTNYFVFCVQNIDQHNIRNTLDKYFISRAVFITLNDKNNYYEIYKMTESMQHELIDTCPKHNDIKLYRKQNITIGFLKKFKNLNVLYNIAPPFVISSTKGIHIELLRVIGKHLNVKTHFIKLKKVAGAVGISPEFINNRTYDLYGALFSLRFVGQLNYIDLSVPVTEDKIVLITPRVLLTNNWTIFYGEFSNSVWIYFVVLLISVSLVIFLIDYLIPEKKENDILSFLLYLLFEGTINVHTRKKCVKIIVINYLLFVLIFSTIYKSHMFNILRKDNSYNPIKCRKDILKFNFQTCMPSPVVFDSFKQSEDPIEQYLGWYSEPVYKDYWGCMNMTAYEQNAVSLKSLKILKYVVPNKYLDENGYPYINILEDDYHFYAYFRFGFRKGHPLLEIFNKKLIILKETGFIQYQYKLYEQQFQKAVAKAAEAQKKHNFNFKALKLSTLQSVFFAYFALIGIGILVFCLEILV
ncbi:Ionotropic receptor 131 [Diabrotica virgifera virgifera]|nr:Ionotropic receptor 131 [Diabrotica virgifera virgifera]